MWYHFLQSRSKIEKKGLKGVMMSYTLSQFLEDDIVPGIRLLTKPLDFRTIPIDSISVQEHPIQNFPQENELVLSTATGCHTEEQLLQLVQEIWGMRASTVLLTFEDGRTEIPQMVIDYADGRDFPVFWIPWEHRFAKIQADVIEKIRSKKIERYQSLQTLLFGAFFDGRPLDHAIAHIARHLECAVAVTDRNGKLQGSGSRPLTGGERKIPIHIGKSLAGYLCLSDAAPAIAPEILEKYVCFPLSLWFNRKNADDMLIMKLKDDFVWNLATGDYQAFEDMVRQGSLLRFDLRKPYICINLKAVSDDDGVPLQQYSNRAAEDAADMEALLISCARKWSSACMVGQRSLEFIIYVENCFHDPSGEVEALIDAVDAQLRQEFPAYEWYWGISETVVRPPDFEKLYQNAHLALQRCLNSNRKKYRCTFQDTKEAHIIAALSSQPAIQEMVRETLQALQDRDSASGMDLLGTLTEFIKCNYNISETARHLHIHRQSLIYRLRKIDELKEMSTDNHRDLFLLEVCVRILLGGID